MVRIVLLISILVTSSLYAVDPADLIAHYKMNDNADSSTVVDSTSNHNGTYKGLGGSVDTFRGAAGLVTDAAMVTFIFDDGWATDYDVMKPLFDTQGEVACCAVISDNIGTTDHTTEAELVILEAAGWEIISHSVDHSDLTGLSEANVILQLTDSKTALEAMGLTISNFVSPGNAFNGTTLRLINDYYEGHRGTTGLNNRILNPYDLYAYVADDHTALATFQGYVDNAEAGKKWVIFYLHATTSNDATAIGTLIDYIQAKDISIVTMSQGLAAVTRAGSKISGALNFNGVNDYVTIADHADFTPISTPFSISVWVYMVDATNMIIASKGVYNTDGEWGFKVASDDKGEFRAYDESEDSCYLGRVYNTALTAYEDQWIHLVVIFDGGDTSESIKVIMNTVRIDDTNREKNATNFVAIEAAGHAIEIGRAGTTEAEGFIDNVMFFGTVLTLPEIQILYNNGASTEIPAELNEQISPRRHNLSPLSLRRRY